VRSRGPVELVLHHPGLHPRGTGLRIELEDRAHVPGEVEHQRVADGLPGQAGAGAAGQHGHPVLGGQGHRSRDVACVPRGDHADRRDRVHAGVTRVQVARVVVEGDLAFDLPGERLRKLVPLGRRCA
jgi:hypothetical protein